MTTKIEWTHEVWNPVTGCTKVSSGCKNCYAETIARRFWGERNFTDVQWHEDRLEIPLHWKKPRRVFVNSMSDLFHEDVPSDFIQRVFEVMREARQHTYQILTKRPERMHSEISVITVGSTITYPFPNVWLGVSVEDQRTANERIPLLLKTPARIRFVSYEPALGPIDFTNIPSGNSSYPILDSLTGTERRSVVQLGNLDFCAYNEDKYFSEDSTKIDWIIMGGESGPRARPMHPDWAISVRDQCQEVGVPFFFKQWGEYLFPSQAFGGKYEAEKDMSKAHKWRIGKKAAGRLLDKEEWNEYPSGE